MNPEKKISIAISPCPNDTYMFHAMLNGYVNTEGFVFQPVFSDVEALNELAFKETYDITKVSFHALGHLSDKYLLLSSGAALGRGCGPLLVSKNKGLKESTENLKVAIPGKYTTANLLFSLMWPQKINKKQMLFSQIESAVINGEVDAGLIIHENRFTYKKKGLYKICDIGEWWEEQTGLPIPLGGIAIKKSLGTDVKKKIEKIIRSSIEYAFKNPEKSMQFVQKYADEKDKAVIKEHIDLYVNNFSLYLGDEGKKAINLLFKKGKQTGIF